MCLLTNYLLYIEREPYMKKKITAMVCVIMMLASSATAIEAGRVDESIVYELEGITDVDNLIDMRDQEYAEKIAESEDDRRRSSLEQVDYGLSEADILALTPEDWIEVERLSGINAEQNDIPVNGEENNHYAASVIKEIVANKNEENNSNIMPRIEIFGWDVNNIELRLAAAHPIEFSWYASISVDADEVADSIYEPSSCWDNGNGDAFRHVAWSALLYCKFYDENDSSHAEAEAHTYLWTNAHEGYEEDESPSPFDETIDIEHRMDLYNNRIGMLLAETRIDMDSYDEDTIFERTEVWIDEGRAKRIVKIDDVRYYVASSDEDKLA